MITRRHLPLLGVLAITLLAACTAAGPTTTASAGEPVAVAAPPGEPLGALPGVEGFAYRAESGGVPGFLAGAGETLGDEVEVVIVQATVAERGDEEVSLIAFGFPGASDTQAVDYFARILDDMEDGFGAGSERGLGGDAYVMTGDGQTAVLAPWGRTADHLVFLFALGHPGATEELVTAILDAEG
jgi:hypothetical protein